VDPATLALVAVFTRDLVAEPIPALAAALIPALAAELTRDLVAEPTPALVEALIPALVEAVMPGLAAEVATRGTVPLPTVADVGPSLRSSSTSPKKPQGGDRHRLTQPAVDHVMFFRNESPTYQVRRICPAYASATARRALIGARKL
jgi:hypothetical protein